MAFDVRMTNYARCRLSETINFIQYVCSNESYATTLLNTIRKVVENLKTQERFRIVDQDISELIGETVYRIKIGKYRLVYRIKPEYDLILIFLFMHESQPLDENVLFSYRDYVVGAATFEEKKSEQLTEEQKKAILEGHNETLRG